MKLQVSTAVALHFQLAETQSRYQLINSNIWSFILVIWILIQVHFRSLIIFRTANHLMIKMSIKWKLFNLHTTVYFHNFHLINLKKKEFNYSAGINYPGTACFLTATAHHFNPLVFVSIKHLEKKMIEKFICSKS